MSIYSFFRYLIFFFVLVLIVSSCSNSKNTEVRRAIMDLSMVKDLCEKDSFPKNDSILNFSVKIFSREKMDSCLAMAYFYQGEIQRRNFYLLRAIDSYAMAEKFAGTDSMLHFKINLELARIYRFKMRLEMEEAYMKSAERLLKSLHDSSANIEYLHEQALHFLNKKDMRNVYATLRKALGIIHDNNSTKCDIYKHLARAYMQSGYSDSVVYFADKGIEICKVPKLKNEFLMMKGLAYAKKGVLDSAKYYIDPNIYNVDITFRVRAYRTISEAYDKLKMLSQAHEFLIKYTEVVDSIVLDRRDELLEKMHGIHEYNIQKDRANKAEMQAASSQLMFSNFLLVALILIMILSVLLHYYRSNKRKLTERLREETCLKMEETIKRRDAEISLARKQEELRQQEIEKLNRNIDYYKQLNNVTLPIIMRRQNAQGALHLSDDDWDIIIGNADACFDMFSRRLKEYCPQLTEDEIRFCCLVKMELSMSLLSEIYHIAKASISRRKMRLKEKMGVENISFDEFIAEF